jgi:hypothetical protein
MEGEKIISHNEEEQGLDENSSLGNVESVDTEKQEINPENVAERTAGQNVEKKKQERKMKK